MKSFQQMPTTPRNPLPPHPPPSPPGLYIFYPSGKATAGEIRKELKARIAATKLSESGEGHAPGLAVVLVGDRRDSATYVRMKKKACEEVGIESFGFDFPEDVTQDVSWVQDRGGRWLGLASPLRSGIRKAGYTAFGGRGRNLEIPCLLAVCP